MNRSGLCGCCDGIEARTPAAIDNRPGLSRISYRAGTWGEFKGTMLDALSAQPQLARLKARGDDDFTIALADAFAVICDILTFYSERSANEHYLATATDVVSTRELGKLVGYKPAPGVAASTALAITIQAPPPPQPAPAGLTPAPQLVPRTIPLAAGLQAQSVPDPGEQPVTFETIAPIEARFSWNALRPRLSRPLSDSPANAAPSHLRLKGLIGSLAAGDWLLVFAANGASSRVNRVAAVSLESASQTTLVTFDGSGPDPDLVADPTAPGPALSGVIGEAAIRHSVKDYLWQDQTQLVADATRLQWSVTDLEDGINALNMPASMPQAFRLGVRASLFGHNAPLYASLPSYNPVGGGTVGSVLPDWDSPPMTVGDDPWGTVGRLSLDQAYPPLVQGAWVVAQAPGQDPIIRQIASVSTVSRGGFLLSGKATQLELEGFPAPVLLTGPLRRGREMIPRVRIARTALDELPIRTTSVLGSTDSYFLAEEPITTPISGTRILLDSAQLGLEPAQQVVVTGAAIDQSNRVFSELRSIASVALVDGRTCITLDRDLDHTYDAASLTINANVAPATHGATKSEILGSGSGALAYQRFALKQPPLTYVSAATPTGISSTLQVRVNGVLWRESPWLAGHGPLDRVYTTSIDELGNTVVQFGDGIENAARLPTGQNNVTATYRQGLGSAGNVRAGQITTLLTRPLGVQAVINPVAASGGGDPDSPASARRNVPIVTRAIDRIVTLEDTGDFARASAAIAKATAVWAWDGRQRVACVTVAGPAGASIDPSTDQFKNLLEAMRAASDGSFPIALCNYVPRTFTVGAKLTVDPDLDVDVVLDAARAALRAAFGFESRDLMQPVYLSEIYAVLQRARGVLAVSVNAFRLTGSETLIRLFLRRGSALPDALIANPPVLREGSLAGAQLLTLEPGLLPQVVHA